MIVLEPDLELTTEQAERLLEAWLSEPVVCSAVVPLKGGMVNSVYRLEFNQPPNRAVVKLHGPEGNSFEREARALDHLRLETNCPVPEVYAHDASTVVSPYAYLLLECMPGECLDGADLGPDERADIDSQLAAVLADLHDHRGSGWGHIGADAQWASWSECFVARLAEARTDPTLRERLAAGVLEGIDEAIGAAGAVLADSGPPTLVHGDVWDGNLMVHGGDGEWRLTALLDPNLQYADSELELAYLEVFDNEQDVLRAAYTDRHPLRPGYEQRRLFYWLHTALIHVALFGDEFFCEYTARTVDKIGALGLR